MHALHTAEGTRHTDSVTGTIATLAPKRRGLSIQLRLVALVVAAALPPLLFSMVQVRAANRKARETAEQVALQLARRIAAGVDDHISVVDASLLTLSLLVRTAPAQQASNDSLLTLVSGELAPRFRQMLVADTLGRIIGIADLPKGVIRPTVADRKYFQDALHSRGLVVGDPVIGRVNRQYIIGIGRAVLGRDGRARAVVAASTALDDLRRLLIPADLPAGAVVTLLDAQGVVLARSLEFQKWVGKDVSALPTIRDIRAAREGVREGNGIDGVQRLSGFATAARVPWQVLVGIPTDIALETVSVQKERALWLGFASLVASLALAWLLARRIAGPVIALTADANAFAEGELAHRSEVQVDGELGQLVATFNRMASALEHRRDELSENERRYRLLFDIMPMAMWVYEVESLKIVAANLEAVKRYGYTRDEFLAMSLEDLRRPEEVPAFRALARKAENASVRGLPARHRTRSGAVLDVEISSDDLSDDMGRTRLVVAFDVTERHRTEEALRVSQEQLRQSQKMEAVGSLAGGIAHDFNNLLTGILGYCDLALEAIPANTEASNDVKEVRRAGERASELTRQLLAFSRRQMLKPTVFSLNVALDGTERILRRLISESIVLDVRASSDPPLVCADPSQVEQVILNLAVNARDAMPRGGRLELSTSHATLLVPMPVVGGTLQPGHYALITVTDNGTGITEEARDRMFEPFFTTKERGQGTGLGLATVYGIVQQSGGSIHVASELGRGSVFTVYFPFAAMIEAQPPEPRQPQATERGKGTILLAEDDAAVRAIAQTTLERAGYRVLVAPNAAAALALSAAHNGSIALLVTDVIMPGMNGRELADRLALFRPGMPVLFVSGYTDNVLADHGLNSMERALLDKPFTPASLTAAVAAMITSMGVEDDQ